MIWDNPNVKNMLLQLLFFIYLPLHRSRQRTMTHELCSTPLTSAPAHEIHILSLFLNNSHIHLNTSTGICPSTARQKQNPHHPHFVKRPVSTLVSFFFFPLLNKILGKHRSLRDNRRVFIWARCKHTDLWLALQVQPVLLGHRPQLERGGGNAVPFLSLPDGTKWRGCDVMRLHIQMKIKDKKMVCAKAR